ncbi:dihydrodipicolinate synthase family protein [Rhizobium sp. C4]|uniref:dihydrodipicolinate synthase family protein n=1 Tax=Rhizobium sp. C4 TaxID=1349800 RepID=UPI001E60BEC3|nr:dihydrodipicolinate synthase family protein [Rhizobium sp. C4]MCD2175994.1 dihydrodipicolinate synthase family protein [Rhizobium sp. C4]
MQGVIAAVPTPLSADLEPVRAPFIAHCRWLLANGCDGLNILGSTGEANLFDGETRRSVMRWAAEDLPRDRLMVGTGTPSLMETIDLTRHAARLGYPIALVLPPYYYKPLTDDGLVAWYLALHEALGDSAIEVYFYNYPQMTGITIPAEVIARLRQHAPARFAGIKDSSGDLAYCRALATCFEGFAVYPSSEVSLGEALASGFAGCISATTNQTSAQSAKVWRDRHAPAKTDLDEISAVRSAIAGPALVASVKSLVAERTGDPIWTRVMPPFVALNDEQRAVLVNSVRRVTPANVEAGILQRV